MGGSSPSGSTTTTSSNVPWNASQLSTIQNQAINMGTTNPINYYPGQIYAGANTNQTSALSDAANYARNAGDYTGASVAPTQEQAMLSNYDLSAGSNPYQTGLMSLGSTNPAAAGMAMSAPVASGAYLQAESPYLSGLTGVASGLAGVTGGTAASDLSNIASGSFVNQNPYVGAAINAAQQPTITNYESAVAPGINSAAEANGRFYGAGGGTSGTVANQSSVAQQNLGTALGNEAANIANPAYQNELNNMTSAAGTLGNLDVSALTGAGNALTNAMSGYNSGVGNIVNAAGNIGNLGVSGANSQASALGTGLTSIQNANNATPALSNMTTSDFNTAALAGNQQQQLDQNSINALVQQFYGQAEAPWTTLQQEANIIGGAIPGTSTTTQPFFSNPLSGALGGLGAVGSLAGPLMGKSDRRLKTDITDLDVGLDELVQLRPVSWKWKDLKETAPRIGFVAQEVQEILPQLVVNIGNTDDGRQIVPNTLAINYALLSTIAVKAIQELKADNDNLRDEIVLLKRNMNV
jgi:hypothetical protein